MKARAEKLPRKIRIKCIKLRNVQFKFNSFVFPIFFSLGIL